MGKILWGVAFASLLAGPASAAERAPQEVWHCQHEDVSDCTAANGRVDAGYHIARNELGLQIFGGPAMPQTPLRIMSEEYRKAGIEIWWIGDVLDSGRDAYYAGFNQRMEEAIDAKYGAKRLRKTRARIDARMKAAEARDQARAARTSSQAR